MNILRKILGFPIALIWDLVSRIRNFFYDQGIFSSQQFDLPIIGVGNLVLGGTGKTPHVEYIVKQILPYGLPGILSRGYKRQTSGYIFASTQSTVKQIGDEPLQYKLKHPHLPVAVSESRVLGIPQFLIDAPEMSSIVLDDIYQHRAVQPGLNILLTDYKTRYTSDFLFPSGNLRESSEGAKRADIIIVTKCPLNLLKEEATKIKKELKPLANQTVYFSTFFYGQPYSFLKQGEFLQHDNYEVLIATGIAKPNYLKNYVKSSYKDAFIKDFGDHHLFTERDVYDIEKVYTNLGDEHEKIVLITEKDAVKLKKFASIFHELQLPVFVQPIQVDFLFDESSAFNNQIINFVNQFHHGE